MTTGMCCGLRVALERGQDLPPVHAGQPDVEDDGHGALGAHRGVPRRPPGTATAVSPRRQVDAEQLGGPPVVLDHHDLGPGGRRAALRTGLLGGPAPRARRAGTANANVLPRPGPALQPDPAAVQLDDPPRQGEPEPGALGLRGAAAALLEGLEDPLPVRLGDADARVGDRHHAPRRPRPRPGRSTVPPSGVNFTALLSRLSSTCLNRSSSAVTSPTPGRRSSTQRRCRARRRARGPSTSAYSSSVLHGERR